MPDDLLLGPPPHTLEVLLDDVLEHDHPRAARILTGLSAQDALAALPGAPYSIAELVAHMNANMYGNLGLIHSSSPASYHSPFTDWPAVSAEAWPTLVEAFLSGLEALKSIAREETLERVLYEATDDEPGWSVGYKLACSVAKHNTYHLGQIVLLRRLLGAWPPAEGEESTSLEKRYP